MSKKSALIILLLITLAGGLVRLAGWDWGEGYRWVNIGDEIDAYEFALDLAEGQGIAHYLGQPQVQKRGRAPGPWWGVLWLIGLRLAGSPEGLILLVALLNTAVIPLTYTLGRRVFDRPTGLWAALLMGLSPWAVCYSIGLQNPMLLAFPGALLFVALWRTVTVDKTPAVFWVALLLALIPFFHFISVILIPPVLFLFLITPQKLHRGWLAAGIIAGAALYIPYFYWDWIDGWTNTKGLLFSSGSGFSPGVLKALTIPLMLTTNWGLRWATGSFPEYLEIGDYALGSFVVLLFSNLVSFGLTGLAFFLIGREIKTRLGGLWTKPRLAFEWAPEPVFILVMLGGPLFLAILSGADFQGRYAPFLLPLLVLIPAFLAARLPQGVKHGKWLLAGLILVLSVNAVYIPGHFHRQAHLMDSGQRFLATFTRMEEVRQTLLEKLGRERRIKVEFRPVVKDLGSDRERQRNAEALGRYLNLLEDRTDRPLKSTEPILLRLVQPNQKGSGKVLWQGPGLILTEAD